MKMKIVRLDVTREVTVEITVQQKDGGVVVVAEMPQDAQGTLAGLVAQVVCREARACLNDMLGEAEQVHEVEVPSGGNVTH
jgi:hypothetical protein